jgi:hypothetical protein
MEKKISNFLKINMDWKNSDNAIKNMGVCNLQDSIRIHFYLVPIISHPIGTQEKALLRSSVQKKVS